MLYFSQGAIDFKGIFESSYTWNSPVKSNPRSYLRDRNTVLFSTHSQRHVETGSQSGFQQIMRPKTSVTASFIWSGISVSLMNTIGEDGFISCFITAAINHVRSP